MITNHLKDTIIYLYTAAAAASRATADCSLFLHRKFVFLTTTTIIILNEYATSCTSSSTGGNLSFHGKFCYIDTYTAAVLSCTSKDARIAAQCKFTIRSNIHAAAIATKAFHRLTADDTAAGHRALAAGDVDTTTAIEVIVRIARIGYLSPCPSGDNAAVDSLFICFYGDAICKFPHST